MALKFEQNIGGERTGDAITVNIMKTQRTCVANPAGENSSSIFTVCVKSVPLYHFQLAFVVLHMTVKEFFGSHF